jgi:hypothetical protein
VIYSLLPYINTPAAARESNNNRVDIIRISDFINGIYKSINRDFLSYLISAVI